jgi:predicted GH43/DUF377 family glycosyl hydrolase
MIRRSASNPILAPRPDLWWSARKLYNSAAVFEDDLFHLIFRAVGDDSISRLGHAWSTDGVAFDVHPTPAFSPAEPWDAAGCEDPRITKLEEQFWMLYTAFDGRTARCAMTSTLDFRSWTPRRLLLPNWREGRWNEPGGRPVMLPGFDPSTWRAEDANWSKAAALFPQKIGGRYWMYFGDDQIWAAHSTDLINWDATTEPVIGTRAGLFDSAYVEMGPPPIKVSAGWLVLYHGVDRLDRGRTYRLGAAIVSLDDPLHVIYRAESELLQPREEYETSGSIDVVDGLETNPQTRSVGGAEEKIGEEDEVARAVFCCGAIPRNGRINVYYSGADTVLCLAEMSL